MRAVGVASFCSPAETNNPASGIRYRGMVITFSPAPFFFVVVVLLYSFSVFTPGYRHISKCWRRRKHWFLFSCYIFHLRTWSCESNRRSCSFRVCAACAKLGLWHALKYVKKIIIKYVRSLMIHPSSPQTLWCLLYSARLVVVIGF